MNCPKCGLENPKNALECTHCGIIFAKYEAYLQKKREKEEMAAAKAREEEEKAIEVEYTEEIPFESTIMPEKPSSDDNSQQENVPQDKQCPYCMETILTDAIKCRYCGEFLAIKDSWENKDVSWVFTGFFDLQFIKMVSPVLLKVNYAAILILGAIAEIFVFVHFAKNDQIGAAIFSVFGFLLIVLLTRLYSEFMIIAFKIEHNTRRQR